MKGGPAGNNGALSMRAYNYNVKRFFIIYLRDFSAFASHA